MAVPPVNLNTATVSTESPKALKENKCIVYLRLSGLEKEKGLTDFQRGVPCDLGRDFLRNLAKKNQRDGIQVQSFTVGEPDAKHQLWQHFRSMPLSDAADVINLFHRAIGRNHQQEGSLNPTEHIPSNNP